MSMSLIDDHSPDPNTFYDAWALATSTPGMGSFTVSWNPYTVKWNAKIDFADKTTFSGVDYDCTTAIRQAIDAFKESGFQGV
jgi:hypothetical protein